MNGIKLLDLVVGDFRVLLTTNIKLGPEVIGLLLEIDKREMAVGGSLSFGDVNKHAENCHISDYIKESKMSSEKSSTSQELGRVATFKDYPNGDTPSALTLARGGFIYIGRGFRVKCPSCEIEVEKFRQDDNPLEEHRRLSPNCPLVALATNSSSLSSVFSSSEAVRQSSPAMQQIINSAAKRSSERMASANDPGVDTNNESMTLPNRVDRKDPDYELLRCERTRLATFYDWPATANAVPEELAREGLFYTGSADRVRCAFCRNALRSWEPGDIPREEHKKYFPNCPFVQNREAEFELASSRQRNCTQNPVSTATSLSISATSGQNADPVNHRGNSGTTGSVEAFMSTPTVRAVLDMGFSAAVVKQTIQHHLDETGELFRNAETLLENLLSHGYKMSSIPVGAEANTTPVVLPNVIEPCASSSMQATQQNAVHDPTSQEIVGNKKRKVKKKKKGASTNKTSSITGSEAAAFEASNSISNSNTSPSTSAATATNTAQGEAEAAENSGMFLDLEEQELMEENTRLREARTCKVCMDKEVDTVFLPCGHLICCSTCSPKVHNCPLCRTFIRGTVKTYLS